MTCPVCQSDNIKLDYTRVVSAPYFDIVMNEAKIHTCVLTRYSRCEDCKLIFQTEMQTAEWYKWFYASGTYRDTLGIPQDVIDADEMKRSQDIIDYLGEMDITPKYHMDKGSSRGYLLKLASDKFGCCVTGDDPNNAYSEMEYSIEATNPDLLTAIHVLEHTLDPAAELRAWSELTSRWMLIEVPGVETKGGPLRFAHLYYFPPELLRKMIEDTGMTVVERVIVENNTRILAEWRNKKWQLEK